MAESFITFVPNQNQIIMNDSIAKLKKDFQEKIPQLEKARRQLKQEYVGIDSAIDEIIENIRSWYTLAEIQPKPTIVNLWGLTGVGKTSLIQRMSELLNVNDRTFRIDLGEKYGKYALKSSMEEITEIAQDEPMIIILDEIQHARTIKTGLVREEVDTDVNRMIWDLIDAGKITTNSWDYGATQIFQYTNLMSMLVAHGVKVCAGFVVTRIDLFAREMKHKLSVDLNYDEKKDDTLKAVPQELYESIISYAPKKYGLKFHEQLHDHLFSLDESELLSFLQEVAREAKKPQIHHFNKALIFVVGNLDEAYHFSANQSADISADEFCEKSKEITIPHVKEALYQRFRSEQIARLGNMHVIYPALNESAYRRLIHMSLENYFQELKNKYHVEWTFKESLVDKIYAEGVYPTQGVRPVFTTISQLVKSKTAIIFQRLISCDEQVDKIELGVENGSLRIQYFNSHQCVLEERLNLPSNLESLREPKKDENQAITAVHEAGHAILLSHLLEQAPQQLTASSSDTKSEGFMLLRSKYKYFPKKELIKHAAIKLGGLMAERLIFGEEHVTMGSFSDIHQMQEMMEMAYKKGGVGKHVYSYANNKTQNEIGLHEIKEVENEVKKAIDEAQELALETLEKEKRLLIHLADELQKVSKIDQKRFIEFYGAYGAKEVDFENESSYYRDKINEELEKMAQMRSIAEHRSIILSMDKQIIKNDEHAK